MPVALFLVHGTFAKDAPWTRGKSLFRMYLREMLKLDGIQIRRTRWSGKNTTKARQAGVEALSAQLRKSLADHPLSQHVVIGHSHGGTIAFQAVNSVEFAKRVSVVLLSTPVLIPRKRQISLRLGFAFALSAWISSVIILLGVSVAFRVPGELAVPMSMAAAGIGIYALYQYLSRMRTFILEKNGVVALPEMQLLIIRESADEASGFLGAVQLGIRLVSMLFSGVEALADRVGKWTEEAAKKPIALKTLVPNAILLLVAIGILGALLHSLADVFHVSLTIVSTAIVLSVLAVGFCFKRQVAVPLARYGYSAAFVLVAMMGCIPTFPLWLLFALLAFPIRESILSAAFVDVSAEPTPVGDWCLKHFMFRGWGLSHSAAHDDPRVFECVADWIKAGARR